MTEIGFPLPGWNPLGPEIKGNDWTIAIGCEVLELNPEALAVYVGVTEPAVAFAWIKKLAELAPPAIFSINVWLPAVVALEESRMPV